MSHRQFDIEIEGGKALGVTLSKKQRSLKVKAVGEGAVAMWNEEHAETPEHTLEPGDLIVDVNSLVLDRGPQGKPITADELLSAMANRKAASLALTVEKPRTM